MSQAASAKPKHVPLRRCVVCRDSKAQAELLRFYNNEQHWQLDKVYHATKRKAAGKGAWLCYSETCKQEKQLKRFFRQDAALVAQEVKTYLESPHVDTLVNEPNAKTPNSQKATLESSKQSVELSESKTSLKSKHTNTHSEQPQAKRVRVASSGGMNV